MPEFDHVSAAFAGSQIGSQLGYPPNSVMRQATDDRQINRHIYPPTRYSNGIIASRVHL
jgi:hypothetical protein